MSAGIVVSGDNNIVQIDSDYQNLQLVRVETLPRNSGNGFGWNYSFSGLSNFVLVGFRCDLEIALLHQYWSGSDLFVWAEALVANNNNLTLYFFDVVDTPPVPPAGAARFEVYDGAGKMVFSNFQNHMDPVVYINSSYTPPTVVTDPNFYSELNYDLPAATYCVVPCKFLTNKTWQSEYEQLGFTWTVYRDWRTYILVSGSNVKLRFRPIADEAAPGGWAGDFISNEFMYLIVKIQG